MIDFINSVDSHTEIKPIELYEQIKTDSSDLNSKILINLQKHENINEFLHQYSKLDFKNELNFLDNFESQSLLISNNEGKNLLCYLKVKLINIYLTYQKLLYLFYSLKRPIKS